MIVGVGVGVGVSVSVSMNDDDWSASDVQEVQGNELTMSRARRRCVARAFFFWSKAISLFPFPFSTIVHQKVVRRVEKFEV